jgi:phosphoglycerol transferase MdoB-like AlkP superfamily enzyme
MKTHGAIRNFYVLPCCLLLLNLGIGVVSYKFKLITDPILRTAAIMGMVLFGAGLVGMLLEPVVQAFVGSLHRRSRRQSGALGEILFLILLGGLVFWLYYRFYIIGPESLLPADWRN